MSRSPEGLAQDQSETYELGWVAIHRMLREGGSWSGHERNKVFWNIADGQFADVSGLSGLDFDHDARAAARVDWDADGLEDLIVVSRNSPRVRVLRNQSQDAGDSIALWLEGTESNRDAVGARVEVHVKGEPIRIAGVRSGEGYLAQSSRWLHVGLGQAPAIERVVVRWPRKSADEQSNEQVFEGLAVGGRYRLIEGQSEPEPVSLPRVTALTAATPSEFQSPPNGRVVLAARPPLPPAELIRPGEPRIDLRAYVGEPMLIAVFASWCAPCVAELGLLARNAEALTKRGVRVLALSVDEPDDRTQALALASDLEWPWPLVFATPEATEALDGLQQVVVDRRQRLSLPSSFLVDGAGDVVAIYRGAIDPATLVSDLGLLEVSRDRRRETAVPFPGRWLASAAPRVPLAALERTYDERGLTAAAADAGRRQLEVTRTSPANLLFQMGSELARLGRMEEASARFSEAVRADAEHVQAQLGLSVALHQLRRVPEAVAGYKRVLRLDPSNQSARFNLSLAYAALREFAAARSELDSLRSLDPAAADRLEAQLDRFQAR